MNAGATEFGAMLRQARKSKGMSQAELGGDTFSGSYISHLESGRRTATPEIIEFVSRRLGLSPLEWGVSAKTDLGRPVAGELIEDLLIAERAWSDHDWNAALTHAQQAADVAAAAGDWDREWESRYVMAQALFASGEFARAADLAETLIEHPTAGRYPVARAQALCLASISNRASDRLGRAVALGARAVEVSATLPPIIEAEALMALVSAMSEAGHPAAESAPYLDRLEALSAELTSAHSRGMIAWAIGTAEFMAGDIAAGIAHHQQAQGLLDARRDLRLWSRFQRSAASCLLGAGITEGVPELVRTASLGIEILGNNHDLAELRQVEAQLALHSGDPERAVRIATEVLADPVLGAKDVSHSGTELVLAEALAACGRYEEAREQYRVAAEALEAEGRMAAAAQAWRHSMERTPSGKY